MSKVDENDVEQQFMLTIDNMAHRYGLLPTEVLSRASTLDITIMDLSAKWEKFKSTPKSTPNLSQEQMLEMIQQVKKRKK